MKQNQTEGAMKSLKLSLYITDTVTNNFSSFVSRNSRQNKSQCAKYFVFLYTNFFSITLVKQLSTIMMVKI